MYCKNFSRNKHLFIELELWMNFIKRVLNEIFFSIFTDRLKLNLKCLSNPVTLFIRNVAEVFENYKICHFFTKL